MKHLKRTKKRKFSFEYLKSIQLLIWSRFFSKEIELDIKIKNPLRDDKHPNACLKKYGNSDYIILLDPPSELHGANVFEAVKRYYNVNFKEALSIIEFRLLKGHTQNCNYIPKKLEPILKVKLKCKFKIREWNNIDSKFWCENTNISFKDLENEYCRPLSYFLREGLKGWFEKYFNTAYINKINDSFKYYNPEKRDWWTNMDNSCIGGYREFNSSKVLIVTKNLKSYLCITNLGYNCRYITHETINIPKDITDYWNENFDKIIYIMDNDETGINYLKKLKENWEKNYKTPIITHYFKFKGHYTDQWGNKKPISDAYDICKALGVDTLKKELKKLI